MASIPCRRILATAVLSARPCLRAGSAAVGSSSPRITAAVAAFPGNKGFYSTTATTTRMIPSPQRWTRQRGSRQTYAHVRRSSTTSPAESKIWTFEEVQSLSSSPPPKKAILIDVREPEELASTGRIPGAANVPVTSAPDGFHVSPDEFEDRFGFARPAAGDEVIFYCRAGVRSRAAAALARDAGWEARVGEYPGSWNEWVAKGGAVER
ncbi:Rhodanese-like domain-containing protein [Nemania sp. NC0429]|nr:Rhodanese-like domain-containing protein [Nemania sp. NC0429]